MTVTETTSREAVATASRHGILVVTTTAVAAAALLWVVAVPVGGLDLEVRKGGVTDVVGLVDVVVAAVLAGVLGGLARRLLARRWPGRTAWTVLAGGVLLVSLLGPAGAESIQTALVLAGLHLAVGLVVIAGYAPARAARSVPGRVA